MEVFGDLELTRRQAEGRPVRVGLIGAGATGTVVALQLATPAPGIELAAISNRTPDRASAALDAAGFDKTRFVASAEDLDRAVADGFTVYTDDPQVVTRSELIDVIVEATGTIEFGAHVVLDAISHGKHIVLINAELDATLGPVLKTKADAAGVIITDTDGDEPGVAMNLYRYLTSVGLRPVAAGNLKGIIDPYRTPETQKAFAEQYNQNPRVVTSFADGTKLAMETAVLANATGFGVSERGMHGYPCDNVSEMASLLPADAMLGGGIVDYALGAAPYTGAWVVVHETHPTKQEWLRYLKMGDGPFYTFYTPYHLPHVQVASSIGRAAVEHDATVTPSGAPACDVVTLAKRDLSAGDVLDGIGGFDAYAEIENSATARAENLLPMGLAEGCTIRRSVPKDQPITYDDIALPEGRLSDKLRNEQNRMSE